MHPAQSLLCTTNPNFSQITQKMPRPVLNPPKASDFWDADEPQYERVFAQNQQAKQRQQHEWQPPIQQLSPLPATSHETPYYYQQPEPDYYQQQVQNPTAGYSNAYTPQPQENYSYNYSPQPMQYPNLAVHVHPSPETHRDVRRTHHEHHRTYREPYTPNPQELHQVRDQFRNYIDELVRVDEDTTPQPVETEQQTTEYEEQEEEMSQSQEKPRVRFTDDSEPPWKKNPAVPFQKLATMSKINRQYRDQMVRLQEERENQIKRLQEAHESKKRMAKSYVAPHVYPPGGRPNFAKTAVNRPRNDNVPAHLTKSKTLSGLHSMVEVKKLPAAKLSFEGRPFETFPDERRPYTLLEYINSLKGEDELEAEIDEQEQAQLPDREANRRISQYKRAAVLRNKGITKPPRKSGIDAFKPKSAADWRAARLQSENSKGKGTIAEMRERQQAETVFKQMWPVNRSQEFQARYITDTGLTYAEAIFASKTYNEMKRQQEKYEEEEQKRVKEMQKNAEEELDELQARSMRQPPRPLSNLQNIVDQNSAMLLESLEKQGYITNHSDRMKTYPKSAIKPYTAGSPLGKNNITADSNYVKKFPDTYKPSVANIPGAPPSSAMDYGTKKPDQVDQPVESAAKAKVEQKESWSLLPTASDAVILEVQDATIKWMTRVNQLLDIDPEFIPKICLTPSASNLKKGEKNDISHVTSATNTESSCATASTSTTNTNTNASMNATIASNNGSVRALSPIPNKSASNNNEEEKPMVSKPGIITRSKSTGKAESFEPSRRKAINVPEKSKAPVSTVNKPIWNCSVKTERQKQLQKKNMFSTLPPEKSSKGSKPKAHSDKPGQSKNCETLRPESVMKQYQEDLCKSRVLPLIKDSRIPIRISALGTSGTKKLGVRTKTPNRKNNTRGRHSNKEKRRVRNGKKKMGKSKIKSSSSENENSSENESSVSCTNSSSSSCSSCLTEEKYEAPKKQKGFRPETKQSYTVMKHSRGHFPDDTGVPWIHDKDKLISMCEMNLAKQCNVCNLFCININTSLILEIIHRTR